jgi:ubiquinone/menaquinone biosynthesis C-methylase UbiE
MSELSGLDNLLPDEALLHYEEGREDRRLLNSVGQLELVRTQELLSRYLPPPPATIFDVGGGAGIYAFWLAQQGYEVHLIDAVPLHIEQARRSSESQPERPLASMAVGDARQLNREEASVDVVLLLGPLYHLTDRTDRINALHEAHRILINALHEAHRILRDGGIVFAAGISRFASTLDGLFRGLLDDPEFVSIAQRDLADGQHRNPNNHPDYFTTAFLHHPEELKTEIKEAGLQCEGVFAIEGPGWLLQNFEEHWGDSARRDRLLEAIC